MKPRYSSNSGIFERRGDPWVSDKEGRAQYGRNLFTEDPDFDRYFTERQAERALSAAVKTIVTDEEKRRQGVTKEGAPQRSDVQRRLTAALISGKNKGRR